MTRNLIIGALASLAIAFSPAAPQAQADWRDRLDDYYDRLEDQRERERDRYEDWLDRQRDAREDYLDWIEDQQDRQRRFDRRAYRGGIFPQAQVPGFAGIPAQGGVWQSGYPSAVIPTQHYSAQPYYSPVVPQFGGVPQYRQSRPGGFRIMGPRGNAFELRW